MQVVELVDGILYYEFNEMLFSIEVTESMCKKHFGYDADYTENFPEAGEHKERNYSLFVWPLPEQLNTIQQLFLASQYHTDSLKCNEDEIRELMDYDPVKYRKYLNRHN